MGLEGGPQPAEGRELVITDLGHMTIMPPSRPGLFPQDHPSDLHERCTVADRYEPLGSDGM